MEDTTTQGNWQGVYGSDGAMVVNDASTQPAYATMTVSGQQAYTWDPSPSAPQALRRVSGSGRIAATWYSNTGFTIDMNLTDGKQHRFAIYCLDWDVYGRGDRIDVIDATTNAVLDTRSVASFSQGAYVVWNLQGHVIVNITRAAGPNAVISGLFWGDVPVNQPPNVYAGGNQLITLPGGAILNGTATDDGLPSNTLTVNWTMVSGPGTVTFLGPTSAHTTATFSAAGNYVLQLSASDGALSSTSQAAITVNSPLNQPPVVNAGSNQTVTLAIGATLNGVVTDDGLPNNTLALTWAKVSGPGSVTFGAQNSAQTTATFGALGIYVLQLSASDGILSASSQVTITVNNSAPPPFQCTANAGTPPLVRFEGHAELMGDLTLSCTGGVPTAAGQVIPQVDITVALNVNVTSRLLANGGLTEALLIMDEPHSATHPIRQLLNCGASGAPDSPTNPGVCSSTSTGDPILSYDGTAGGGGFGSGRPNVFQGRTTAASNVLLFTGIPLDPPGALTRTLRITNIRADAAQAPLSGFGDTVRLIMGNVAVTGPTAPAIANSQQSVAFVQNGLTATILNGSSSYLQCNSVNASLSQSPGTFPAVSNGGNLTQGIRFVEGFATSWKAKNVAHSINQSGNPGNGALTNGAYYTYSHVAATVNYPSDLSQDVPGAIYNTEMGFQNGGPNAEPNPDPPVGMGPGSVSPQRSAFAGPSGLGTAGLASQGTRLAIKFGGIPTGVGVWVPSYVYLNGQFSEPTDPRYSNALTFSAGVTSGVAVLTSTAADGSGPFSRIGSGSSNTLQLVTGSVAVYEVVFADPFTVEYVDIPIVIGYVSNSSQNLPALGTVQVSAGLAPFSADPSTALASSVLPVPRFAALGTSGALFSVVGCAPAPGANAAQFVTTDRTTQGNWQGVYGSDGAIVINDASSPPAYATVAASGNLAYTWDPSPSAPQALKKLSGTGRIAATWYSGSSFNIDMNLTDGQTHPFALYCLDWDVYGRGDRVDVLDAATNAILDTRTVTAFSNGAYLVWNLTGHVILKITPSAGPNAVISGLFWGSGNPPVNQPPVVNAGSNQTITLPSTATLNGTATDDGLPSNTLTVTWSKISGPGTVTFASPNSAQTSATFSTAGTYVLQLSASDTALSATSQVTITVNNAAANQPPVVSAGSNQTITLPSTATLNGTATDDGLPSNTLTVTWSKISGPGTVTFASPNSAQTSATFSTAGTYVLQLSASDTALSATSQVTITVNNAAANQPPVVSAGSNQTITLPSTAALSGTATDDGLPNNTLTVTWSKISGPGTVTFASPNSAQTTATFSAAGTYVLQLSASDGASSSSSQVTITVSAAPPPGTNAAQFVATDRVTQGNWQGVYGSDGASVINDASTQPAYVSLTPTGQQSYTWDANAVLPQALKKISGTGRIAATWYAPTSFTIDMNLTDGQQHSFAIYCLDWDGNNRSERIDVLDAATNNVLDTRTVTAFSTGAYLVWNVRGHVILNVTKLTGPNAVISGLFWGLSGPPTNQAPVVNAGPNQNIALPAGATLNGTATDDGLPSNTLTVNWSKTSGPGTVTFTPPNAAATLAAFSAAGTYVLQLSATDGALTTNSQVTITVTTAPPPGSNAAQFVTADTTTQGNWKTAYGADGAIVIDDAAHLPAYATLTPSGQQLFDWAPSTSLPQALVKISDASSRIAATWYSNTAFTMDMNFSGGQSHPFAIYSLDWDGANTRSQRIEILDADTNAVLDTRNLTSYSNGIYLVWSISGHVLIRVTHTGGANAVISGLFWGGGF